ncbi:MAG: hypothetical protein KF887_14960 [Paracoccaceae bacterium]|nr:MAG: hypothetical protein KF887_14960 [Paracoccaceae bacterium]
MTEAQAILILCAMLGGEAETRQDYAIDHGSQFIRVDCETADEVIEVGLDGKRSSIDSVHQAVFAAHLTGKRPRVILIDRDGAEDRAQHQVRIVAQGLGVAFGTVKQDALIRWHMTAYLRSLAGQGPAGPGT